MSNFMVILLIVVLKQRPDELAASTDGQTENGDTRTRPQLMDANPLFLKKSPECRDFSREYNFHYSVPVPVWRRAGDRIGGRNSWTNGWAHNQRTVV